MEIEVRYDSKRGCGWRKPGGMYLVSGGLAAQCGKLPIPLTVCPTCNAGIKPSRGWTWIDGTALVQDITCKFDGEPHCFICPMSGEPGRVGLLWIGEQYYPTTAEFTKEAASQGISRRIAAIPHDFKLGETWVWFAHRKAISKECENCGGLGEEGDPNIQTKPGKCIDCNGEGKVYTPAIFHAFKPTAIEYVIKGTETEEEIDNLVKRGITPIKIEKVGETKPLELAGG